MEKQIILVGITNGVLKKEVEVTVDGEWVKDEKDALDMVETQIAHNKYWKVVRVIK